VWSHEYIFLHLRLFWGVVVASAPALLAGVWAVNSQLNNKNKKKKKKKKNTHIVPCCTLR
jgi:hypothetical protein